MGNLGPEQWSELLQRRPQDKPFIIPSTPCIIDIPLIREI